MFNNKRFLIIILFGVVITIYTLYQTGVYQKNLLLFTNDYTIDYPFSVFNTFILCNPFCYSGIILVYCLPVLSCLPYGDSLYTDIKSGHIKIILCKVSKKKYYMSKFITVFISGFMVGFIILSLNLILTMMFFPSIKPEGISNLYPLTARFVYMNTLYIDSPYLYCIFYLIINCMYCGMYALISLVATLLFEYRATIILFPGIFMMFINRLLIEICLGRFSTQLFLFPFSQIENCSALNMISVCVVYIACIFIFVLLKEKNRDVF